MLLLAMTGLLLVLRTDGGILGVVSEEEYLREVSGRHTLLRCMRGSMTDWCAHALSSAGCCRFSCRTRNIRSRRMWSCR